MDNEQQMETSDTPHGDASAAQDRTDSPHKPRRKKELLLFSAIVLALVVLWQWQPWRSPIKIIEGTNPKDGATMAWVSAGKFTMGMPFTWEEVKLAFLNGGWWYAARNIIARQNVSGYDAPRHTVYLDGYWVYKYEVTVAQYRTFCKKTGHKMPPAPGWGWQDEQPIVNVTWHDAATYAKWAGVTLPTEAQWEKAALGTDKRVYPWGNTWDAAKCANGSNSTGSSHTGTWPVGSFPSDMSPYGVMDMAGNAFEWCADWYGPYPSTPMTNYTGPTTGTYRVVRGGCWGSFGAYEPRYRGASRGAGLNLSDFKGGSVGFRCVSHLPGPQSMDKRKGR